MKVPFSWLKQYVDIDVTAQELEDKLFGCGFEVEELIDLGGEISKVVVGVVTERYYSSFKISHANIIICIYAKVQEKSQKNNEDFLNIL